MPAGATLLSKVATVLLRQAVFKVPVVPAAATPQTKSQESATVRLPAIPPSRRVQRNFCSNLKENYKSSIKTDKQKWEFHLSKRVTEELIRFGNHDALYLNFGVGKDAGIDENFGNQRQISKFIGVNLQSDNSKKTGLPILEIYNPLFKHD
jgi:hypothetical protein